jgi:hypothetical protein
MMNDTRENEIAALRVIRAGKLKSKDANRMMDDIDAWYLDIIFTKGRIISTCQLCEREFRYEIPKTIGCESCKWNGKSDERCKGCKDTSGFPTEWEHKCPVCDRKKPARRKKKIDAEKPAEKLPIPFKVNEGTKKNDDDDLKTRRDDKNDGRQNRQEPGRT